MLSEEVELFTRLSGRDGSHTSVEVIGAFLDGYEKGNEDSQAEVIYCKECKHSNEKPIGGDRYWCKIHDSYMMFCSDAERRTDE